MARRNNHFSSRHFSCTASYRIVIARPSLFVVIVPCLYIWFEDIQSSCVCCCCCCCSLLMLQNSPPTNFPFNRSRRGEGTFEKKIVRRCWARRSGSTLRLDQRLPATKTTKKTTVGGVSERNKDPSTPASAPQRCVAACQARPFSGGSFAVQ